LRVAPWSPDDGAAPLRNTLNLVIMGQDEELIDTALDDRSIRNVYVGQLPSYFSAPNMPHDGYLAEFLMPIVTERLLPGSLSHLLIERY
jgi:hypothetical protein